ncbi:MAG: phosphopantetheine-binding protein [Eubacterium sp.]
MDTEEIRESILDILQELHEDVDFENEEQLVDNKVLDSFDLVTLVAELGEEFDVEITAKDFVTENFNSVDRLTNMVARLMDE